MTSETPSTSAAGARVEPRLRSADGGASLALALAVVTTAIVACGLAVQSLALFLVLSAFDIFSHHDHCIRSHWNATLVQNDMLVGPTVLFVSLSLSVHLVEHWARRRLPTALGGERRLNTVRVLAWLTTVAPLAVAVFAELLSLVLCR